MMILLRSLRILLFILITLGASRAFAYERPDAFIVKIYDQRVRVLSPSKYDETLAVIIENKTLTPMRGKLETYSGETLNYVSIDPGKSASLSVKRLNKERLFFIPIAPPLQKVELKLGNKPYEIPPR